MWTRDILLCPGTQIPIYCQPHFTDTIYLPTMTKYLTGEKLTE